MLEAFGDYVVYVDESGDHSLNVVDPEFPVFVLAFCLIRIDDYVDSIVPALQRLKFDHFGHDMVILHEREIRKASGPFAILQNPSVREGFVSRISHLMATGRFTVIASVIKKREFIQRRGRATNPYHVALEYGLERVFLELRKHGQTGRPTHVIFESRGAKKDRQLREEYDRIMQRGGDVPGSGVNLGSLSVASST